MMRSISRTAALAVAFVLSAVTARAQWTGFSPDTPPEPGERGVLVLKSQPKEAALMSGGGSYTPGATARISTARTSAIWKFKGWTDETGDTISRSTAASLTVPAGVTRLTACYDKDTDTLHIEVAATDGGGRVYGGGTYDNTQRPYIYCYANTGFRFVSWTRGDEVVSTASSFYYDRRDGEKSVTLTANFVFDPLTPAEPDTARLCHTVYIQCDPDVGGTVNYGSGTTMLEGDEITLTAQANNDFIFIEWLRDGEPVSEEPSYRLRMGRSDTYVTARFEFSPGTPAEPLTPVTHTYTVYAGTVTTHPGQAVYMPIYLENTGTIDRLDFSLRMPPMFDVVADSTQTTARTVRHSISTTRRIEGDSIVADVSITGDTAFINNNGAVAYLYITAADTTSVGTYGADFTAVTGYSGTSTRHPSSRGATIIVEKALPTDILGDVNGDGRINIQDVAMLTGYIHGRRYDSFIKANADINGDGRINVMDVALLLKIIIIQNFLT